MATPHTWSADPALAWLADELGTGTSKTEGADEWTEIQIFRTEGGSYLITGKRFFENGDRCFEWLNVQRSAKNVVKALSRTDRTSRERFLPLGAEAAVEKAAQADPAIRAALDSFDLGE